jgi:hypothetical protein
MDVQTKRRDIGRRFDYAAGHASCTVEEDEEVGVVEPTSRTRESTGDGRWRRKPDH